MTGSIFNSYKIFDEEYIYTVLQNQINESKTYYDLDKLIHHLLPIHELKKILWSQLAKLRKVQKQKESTLTNRSLLQQLYLQTASLEELFTDDILINMIRFLPSNHYPKMPIISSKFRLIMRKYPSIYRQYTVNIALDNLLLNNEGVLCIVINHFTQSIRITDQLKDTSFTKKHQFYSLQPQRQFEQDIEFNDPFAIKYKITNIDDIVNKVPFLWFTVKKWNIKSIQSMKTKHKNIQTSFNAFSEPSPFHNRSYFGAPSMPTHKMNEIRMINNTQKYDNEIDEKATENNLFVSILNKASNYVESLCIDNVSDQYAAKRLLLNELKPYKLLNHICINQVIPDLILESWLNTKQQLKGIKYLELKHITPKHLDTLKQIIEACANLMVFDCYMEHSANISNCNEQNEHLSITFPENIQFIRLQFVGQSFKVDLSECNQLCALHLNDMISQSPSSLNTIYSANAADADYNSLMNENIIWPKNGGVECLLLEQAIDDIHNMNTTVPLYINEWYDLLTLRNLIPVRCVRYITHPFIKRTTPNAQKRSALSSVNEDDIDSDEDIPEPPSLLSSIPLFKFDDYDDPLKYDKDSNHFMSLEELNQIAYLRDNMEYIDYNYKQEIIKVLNKDEDHLYRGYLWKLVLKLKYKNKNIEERLRIYEDWFDIGVGVWVRELGSDFYRYNFANASAMFLTPYSITNQPAMRASGW